MQYHELFSLLTEFLGELHSTSSDEDIKIEKTTIPFFDVAGFDSLASVCITARCFETLGIEDNTEKDSIFIGKNEKGNPYPLTIDDTVKILLNLVNNKKGS